MEMGQDQNRNGGDLLKIAELKLKSQEKEGSCEVDRYRREILSLRETAARLKDDCSAVRERALKDEETIMSLLENLERKDREFAEKLIDLDRAKKREVDEWKKKCEELEAQLSNLAHEISVEFEKKFVGLMERNRYLEDQALRLVEENSRLKGKEKEYSELEACILKFVEAKFHLVEKEKGVENAEGKMQSFERGNGKNAHEINDELSKRTKKFSDDTSLRSVNIAEEVANEGSCAHWKRNCNCPTSKRSYLGRIPSLTQVRQAKMRAESLQRNLSPRNPSFVKSMSRSHVLRLPLKFCKKNLPARESKMTLEVEVGLKHEVKYLGQSAIFSAGWHGFALNHKLELGDALIFELTKPTRFKVHIIKAMLEDSQEATDKQAMLIAL